MNLSNRLIWNIALVGFLTPAGGWLYYTYFKTTNTPQEQKPQIENRIESRFEDANLELTNVTTKLEEISVEKAALEERKKVLEEFISSLKPDFRNYVPIHNTPFFQKLEESTRALLKRSLAQNGRPLISLKSDNKHAILKIDGELLVLNHEGRFLVSPEDNNAFQDLLVTLTGYQNVSSIEVKYNQQQKNKLPRVKKYLNDIFGGVKPKLFIDRKPAAENLSIKLIYDSEALRTLEN